ncbi:MAG TPA: hypothetical protein VMN04_15410 [Thermoanaerobaculia bacterium]|nr:hypothetical protein [Thermoanaerobaculia bacterium]
MHFNADAGQKLENAKGYQCVLFFSRSQAEIGVLGAGEIAAKNLSHKQDAPFTDDVRGPINP